ncbi:MAG: helicase [Desulfuromonas sp.]|nr:helicase [Desulfuromonas sp.]
MSLTDNTLKNYSTTCRDLMRHAIAKSDGNEVFFLGHTDPTLAINGATILARGNHQAVPAITSRCCSGDTVIHNHPSGNLTPSSADLTIAARLGEMGVGFHIVDNSVENVYKIVDACPAPQHRAIQPDTIAELLGPEGALATHLDNYEERPEQLRMAFAAAEAFNNDGLAAIEAGTGTGKSLAYLVPAILWSLRNEQPVAISTNTINLQEQLISKDLPLLKKALNDDFIAVLVKGRNNYLCLRRTDNACREPELFQSEHTSELNHLSEWATTTKAGSRDELTFIPAAAVWAEVCCEIDQCPRTRCPHYSNCFFHKARRRASHADLLIVNHALLLADLAVRAQTENYSSAAVLPPYSRIIIDEAHHLEDAATRNFSIRISAHSFGYILNRLVHPRKQDRGMLSRLLSSLAKELPDSHGPLYDSLYQRIEELLAHCRQLRDEAMEQFSRQRNLLSPDARETRWRNDKLRWRITPDQTQGERWQHLQDSLQPLTKSSSQVALQLELLIKLCEQLPDDAAEKITPQLIDIRGMRGRLSCLSADLSYFLSANSSACTWLEIIRPAAQRKDPVLWLNTAPISVANTLKEAVYDRFRSIILTSATLTVNHRFTFFNQRTGLDLCPDVRRSELLLESPFDFATQAIVAVPTDIAPPTHNSYAAMLSSQIEQAVQASNGRSFVLFTAYSLLRKLYNELEPPLHARGLNCLCQGQSARHLLLKKFRQSHQNILFGTDSFWEGVDVPGRALEQVIITRLPFRVPTEPIQIARSEFLKQQGRDPFMHYTVPQAVLRLKQGFGRLIRHRQDRGVVLILDQRVASKGYGRIFLNSLPPARRIIAPAVQIQQALIDFFNPPSSSGEDPPITEHD